MITGRQIKAARALIGADQADLAKMAGVSRATVAHIENGGDAKASTLVKIASALVVAGVRFIDDGTDIGAVFRQA